ncbi:MAG: ESPR-type extended signal peptide-containing protein, partial [Negativicoccus succinicivorans]|nr:ESPR-type extended signal peptide-containing protein [Negativicoccus succinicivorans]
MNRIYEVIWNKSKNSCSVVSEMAKNLGKTSGCRNKAVLAAMILSLLSAGGLAYAEDPATPPAAPDKKIPYFSVNANNSAKPAGTNWESDGAKGAASIAVGPSAGAQGDFSAAVGPWAKTDGKYANAFGVMTNATGKYATAVGPYAKAVGDYTLAAGKGAKSTAKGAAAFGASAQAVGDQSSAFGVAANASGRDAIAAGSNTVAGAANAS